MTRKRSLYTFRECLQRHSFDEYPVLPPGIDPQLHLSRNSVPQPFFLQCGKDTVIVQMAGLGRLEFRETSVRWFDLSPGDFVYVPAGAAHRLVPQGHNVTYRFRAERPGREVLSWYCEHCGAGLLTYSYDADDVLLQRAYAHGCEDFNDKIASRPCPACGHVATRIELSEFRWQELAQELSP